LSFLILCTSAIGRFHLKYNIILLWPWEIIFTVSVVGGGCRKPFVLGRKKNEKDSACIHIFFYSLLINLIYIYIYYYYLYTYIQLPSHVRNCDWDGVAGERIYSAHTGRYLIYSEIMDTGCRSQVVKKLKGFALRPAATTTTAYNDDDDGAFVRPRQCGCGSLCTRRKARVWHGGETASGSYKVPADARG